LKQNEFKLMPLHLQSPAFGLKNAAGLCATGHAGPMGYSDVPLVQISGVRRLRGGAADSCADRHWQVSADVQSTEAHEHRAVVVL